MAKIELVFRSGTTVRIDVAEFKLRKDASGIFQASWERGKDFPYHIKLDELVAVIER